MRIAVTGSSGFIATNIMDAAGGRDIEWLPLKRNESENSWIEKLKKADVVINLAGAPVIQRWTVDNMQQIANSRLKTTRKLVNILNTFSEGEGPETFISGSAIGIFPAGGEEVHDEYSEATGSFFLTELVKKWEAEANALKNEKIRLVIPRIGIVLGKDGGLLKKTLPLFRLGLGGKIASGNQAMSFIHIKDLVKAFYYFIDQKDSEGVYNMVAPEIVTNMEFTKALANALNKPALFTVPAFALKLIFGKSAAIMIEGEKVKPKRLLDEGFVFDYPDMNAALRDIV